MLSDVPIMNMAQMNGQRLAIEVRGLKKSFSLKHILRGIDLALPQGQRMALLGANGAGKTTLLRLLAGLANPDAGQIWIQDLDSARETQQVRHQIGFVAHQPYLYEELTALENLLFFARMYSGRMVGSPRERAYALLLRVGLQRRAHERVSTLSRGQVQRLSWARALLHAPRILLLDEADSGLDREGDELINTLLAEHTAHGGSTLFSTHQLERALAFSDQIVLLAGGRVAYQGMTQDVTLVALQQIYEKMAL